MPDDAGSISIRDAVPEDAEVLATLLGELGYPCSAADVQERMTRVLDAGDRILVAADGLAVLGLVTVHLTPVLHRPVFIGRVTALVVASGARSRGVGRRLMQAAEEIFREAGCERAELTSGTARTRAHEFYRREGYAEEGRRFVRKLR